MSEQQETKKPAGAGQKNRYRFGLRNQGAKSTYKSKVVRLEEDIFDVGAMSDPAKYSKSLKSIENYIQKTYKKPDTTSSRPSSYSSGPRLNTQGNRRRVNVWMRTEILMKTHLRWQSLSGRKSIKE